ncbi:MAG: glutamate--tRNA ligase [Phycisphaerales bacterium]|nr:glutamate--tRNA ligase [Phycisphaerales bacterium]
MSQVITRFAPSPTGHLHIGGARTALFCWAFARRSGGRFMIRIEDTDQARSSEESARGILEDLAWLGIEWDDGPTLEVGSLSEASRPGAADASEKRGARVIGADARPVGPYFQARRVPIYTRYLRQLVQHGRAYPAFETSEVLEAQRKAAVAAKQTYRYDRASWKAITTPIDRLAAMDKADREGRPYVIRFFAPHEEIIVHDQVLGDVKYAAGEMDDFVIRKADGFPTYHFAVVIDDELMGVTHILRAQEHLNNTPRHVALQKALVIHPDDAAPGRPAGSPFRTPIYGHMPLIFNMDATKMSKRDKAKAARKAAKDAIAKDRSITAATLAAATGLDEKLIADFLAAENDSLDVAARLAKHFKVTLPEVEVWDYRQNGYLPHAITNFLSLLGWNPGLKTEDGKDLEKFDNAFLAAHFAIDRIGKTNAKFDRNKLLSFNADAIAALSDEQFASSWMDWMRQYEPEAHSTISRLAPAQLLTLARALKPRAKTLRDALRPAAFALTGDDDFAFEPAAVEKNLSANERAGLKLLAEFKPRLEAIADAGWTPESINTTIETFAKEKGMPNAGPVAQPLRVALTGTSVSPGMAETLAVLGRASTLKRIERCLSTVGR